MDPEELQNVGIRIRAGTASTEEMELFYEELDRCLGPYVARFARSPVLEAEDLLQGVLAHLARNLVGWQQTTPLRPWIFKVGRNYCISEIRRHRKQGDLLGLDGEEDIEDSLAVAPYDQIFDAEDLELYDRVFKMVDPECQTLLQEAALLRMMKAETAGKRTRTSDPERQRLSRCRKKLMEHYERKKADYGRG